jgi:hypothetical protein
MSTRAPSSPWPDWFAVHGFGAAEEAAFQAARELCAAAQRLFGTARAFAEAGRPVELSGLELSIGRLAAASLDLDPEHGRRLRPDLEALLIDLDRLQRAIEAGPP